VTGDLAPDRAFGELDAALEEAISRARDIPASGLAAIRTAHSEAREEARRFLARLWVRAVRGPVTEPHLATGWDSGLRVAVAEALAARLLALGVDPDLVALLLSGWAATYTEPPLEDDVLLAIVRRLAPLAEAA
jgi:hypothetical protein